MRVARGSSSSSSATGATIMAYDEDSNIIRMTHALGETTEFAYDVVDLPPFNAVRRESS